MELSDVIKQRLNYLHEINDNKDPPIKLDNHLKQCGVSKVIKRPLDSKGGYLFEQKGRFTIVVNSQDPLTRQRFTIAHEIAHIILSDTNIQDKEKVCHAIAAEILMPEEIFRRYATSRIPSPDSVYKLSRIFDCSLRAVIKRLVYLHIWPVVFIWWKPYGLKGHPQALRVSSFEKSKSSAVYIPIRDSIGSSSIIGEAYVKGESVHAIEDLSLGNLRGKYFISAKLLHDGSVLSVILLDQSFVKNDPMERNNDTIQLSLWRDTSIEPEIFFPNL